MTLPVQSLIGTATSTFTTNLTFASPVTPGNRLIAVATTHGTGGPTGCVINDNVNGGNYHNDVAKFAGGNAVVVIASIITTNGTPTVTLTFSGGATPILDFYIAEVTCGAFDVGDGAANGVSTTLTSNSITTQQNNEILIGALITANSRTVTASGSFVKDKSTGFLEVQYLATNTAGSNNTAGTITSSSAWEAGIAAYLPASATGDGGLLYVAQQGPGLQGPFGPTQFALPAWVINPPPPPAPAPGTTKHFLPSLGVGN